MEIIPPGYELQFNVSSTEVGIFVSLSVYHLLLPYIILLVKSESLAPSSSSSWQGEGSLIPLQLVFHRMTFLATGRLK